MPYTYTVKMSATAVTAAITLIQVKAGCPVEVISASISQVTKTSTEILRVAVLRKSATATVTSATPGPLETTAPAALSVGGTSATGINASGEGTDSTILHDDHWNVINGTWLWLPVPEERIWVPTAGFIALKLFTAPAASMTMSAYIKIKEYQG